MAKTVITQLPKKFSVLMIIISIGTALLFDTQSSSAALPELDSNISPLHQDNRHRLQKRLVAAFDETYEQYLASKQGKAISDKFEFYYFRQELQALLDMYYATSDTKYLKQAKFRSFSAIDDAIANTSPLKHNGKLRGNWPCFNGGDIIDNFYGHRQLNDFQGSAGLMMVAKALKEAQDDSYKKIADFVEKNIVEKWLYCKNPELNLSNPKAAIMAVLDGARDKREHFAFICLYLDKLGYKKYPYKAWADFLIYLYVGSIRENMSVDKPPKWDLSLDPPKDWGVVPQSNGSFIWYWTTHLVVQDTSHANRTVWLAVEAYDAGLISRDHLNGFINTFKKNVWLPEKGIFYFRNHIDGTDVNYSEKMGPGRKGNIWFGWNRLAAYDESLKELFVSLGYDLTNGGPNVMGQNKGMKEAPLCLIAWAARLLSSPGQPQVFP
jgi:hypothetical protein